MNQFLQEVLEGLQASPKHLSSKYFYDATGDKIFQEIMECPEYYLTNCELEIFSHQTPQLAMACMNALKDFDVVELGPGNALKSAWLIKCLLSKGLDFTYYPIDISENVISTLEQKLPETMPAIKIQGLNGEYFEQLSVVKNISSRNKLVLFLGSSIGNIPLEETVLFFSALRQHLIPGDVLLTGFDLKKDGATILKAYNDSEGITRRFNLNLLTRMNRELGADFDIEQFEHKPQYDEIGGACRSYLVSKVKQQVRIGDDNIISFEEGEPIFMEIAQKYTVAQTDEFALKAGYQPISHFYDSKKWFLDTLWQVV